MLMGVVFPRVLGTWLAVLLLCSCREQVQSRVSEHNANEILTTLFSAGIRATKSAGEEGSWSVEVDEDDMQRSLQVLRERGVPRETFVSTGEIFKKEGLISTPAEERMRFLFAVSQELSNTLSQIDGVVSARVHPVIPANDPLTGRIQPASASVFIKHRRDANLQAMAPAIRNLVMRSIEGLAYENISLTFVAAEDPPPNTTVSARAGGFHASVNGLTAVLGALLLAALCAVAYLWSRVRQYERGYAVQSGQSVGHAAG
jgi:type III secretion protein J